MAKTFNTAAQNNQNRNGSIKEQLEEQKILQKIKQQQQQKAAARQQPDVSDVEIKKESKMDENINKELVAIKAAKEAALKEIAQAVSEVNSARDNFRAETEKNIKAMNDRLETIGRECENTLTKGAQAMAEAMADLKKVADDTKKMAEAAKAAASNQDNTTSSGSWRDRAAAAAAAAQQAAEAADKEEGYGPALVTAAKYIGTAALVGGVGYGGYRLYRRWKGGEVEAVVENTAE